LGDGTVTRPSLERGGLNPNSLNAPGSRIWFNWQQPSEDEHLYDHTGMTHNPRVLGLVQYLLGRGRQPNYPEILVPPPGQGGANAAGNTASAANSESSNVEQQLASSVTGAGNATGPASITPSYYITLSGPDSVVLTDDFGNSNEDLDGSMSLSVPRTG